MNMFLENVGKDTKPKRVKLSEFVGEKILTGFSSGDPIPGDQYYDDANTTIFVLDGVTYMAIEDPVDGYRSHLDYVVETDQVCKNIIPPHKVVGRMRKDDHYQTNNTVEFVDVITGLVVMAIGTDNTDDYYPYCVMEFQPPKLAVNKEPKKYNVWLRERKFRRILKQDD